MHHLYELETLGEEGALVLRFPDAGDLFEEFVGIDSRFGIDVAFGVDTEVITGDKKKVRKQFFEVDAFAEGDATGAEFRADWQQAFGNAVKATLSFKPSELAQAY